MKSVRDVRKEKFKHLGMADNMIEEWHTQVEIEPSSVTLENVKIALPKYWVLSYCYMHMRYGGIYTHYYSMNWSEFVETLPPLAKHLGVELPVCRGFLNETRKELKLLVNGNPLDKEDRKVADSTRLVQKWTRSFATAMKDLKTDDEKLLELLDKAIRALSGFAIGLYWQ